MRALASEYAATMKIVQDIATSPLATKEQKLNMNAQLELMLMRYNDMAERADRAAAAEAGDDYTPPRATTTKTADPAASLKVTRREK
jgi:hypothetical protein